MCRVSNSDIKDTNDLVAARKKVERQMERFKVCERETKTKAFSKEGLGQAMKLDPKEKARNEIRGWINVTVEKLAEEVGSVALAAAVFASCKRPALDALHAAPAPACLQHCCHQGTNE